MLDSGCTNHMTGEKRMFKSYEENKNSYDSNIFGDSSEGRVTGLGKISITT